VNTLLSCTKRWGKEKKGQRISVMWGKKRARPREKRSMFNHHFVEERKERRSFLLLERKGKVKKSFGRKRDGFFVYARSLEKKSIPASLLLREKEKKEKREKRKKEFRLAWGKEKKKGRRVVAFEEGGRKKTEEERINRLLLRKMGEEWLLFQGGRKEKKGDEYLKRKPGSLPRGEEILELVLPPWSGEGKKKEKRARGNRLLLQQGGEKKGRKACSLHLEGKKRHERREGSARFLNGRCRGERGKKGVALGTVCSSRGKKRGEKKSGAEGKRCPSLKSLIVGGEGKGREKESASSSALRGREKKTNRKKVQILHRF